VIKPHGTFWEACFSSFSLAFFSAFKRLLSSLKHVKNSEIIETIKANRGLNIE
jgi:hypothetical protein